MKLKDTQYSKRLKSKLMRHPTKRHFLDIFQSQKPKRHRTETFYEDERSNPITMARVLGGIVILHIIFIAGFLGHKKISAGMEPIGQTEEVIGLTQAAQAAEAAMATQTASAAATAQDEMAEEIPKMENEMVAVTIDELALPLQNDRTNMLPPAVSNARINIQTEQNFITTAPAVSKPKPSIAAARVAAASRHHILSGETWHSIASKHQISIALLKSSNPKAAARPTIYAGEYLAIPSSDGKAPQEAIDKNTAAASYSIKSGDTLAAIARKHKMSTAKLMKLNSLTNKDARRIRPGQVLIIRN